MVLVIVVSKEFIVVWVMGIIVNEWDVLGVGVKEVVGIGGWEVDEIFGSFCKDVEVIFWLIFVGLVMFILEEYFLKMVLGGVLCLLI